MTHAVANCRWFLPLFLAAGVTDLRALKPPYDVFPPAEPPYHRVRYEASDKPGGEAIPAGAPRHVVAVSVNNLLGFYLDDPQTFVWLRNRAPSAVIGGTLYAFDLTGDHDAIRHVRAVSER